MFPFSHGILEFQAMVEAGLLQRADLGVLASGKQADIAAMADDPLADIAAAERWIW
jgi:imidazolonepropionase-like amidohydrolase